MNLENSQVMRMSAKTRIDRVEAFALACSVDGGPVSTLADMPVRSGLVFKLTDADGCFGWGEAWCNYPPKGNLAKLALLADPILPQLNGIDLADWRAVRPQLERRLHRMILHTGEPGPFAHCFAGIDMAMADMEARRQGVGLSKLLGAHETGRVAVYASSPSVEHSDELSPRLSAQGHTGVKIKVGFDLDRDIKILERFRSNDDAGMQLFVDANQNWDVGDAVAAAQAMSEFDVSFVEEPILADASCSAWQAVSRRSVIPLAAGENIASLAAFKRQIDDRTLSVVQPDVAKWGGMSGAFEVGRYAAANGATCTLHYMGTAVGLAASLHALAAIGGPGRVELDANPNPLRTDLGEIDLRPRDGEVALPKGAGMAFVPDPEALRRYGVGQFDITL